MKAEKDSVDKTLKEVGDGLQKAQDERKQPELSLSTVTADLENSKAAMAKLKDACTFIESAAWCLRSRKGRTVGAADQLASVHRGCQARQGGAGSKERHGVKDRQGT
ncbi:unnamed protein product [Ixodes persulcatus]